MYKDFEVFKDIDAEDFQMNYLDLAREAAKRDANETLDKNSGIFGSFGF